MASEVSFWYDTIKSHNKIQITMVRNMNTNLYVYSKTDYYRILLPIHPLQLPPYTNQSRKGSSFFFTGAACLSESG